MAKKTKKISKVEVDETEDDFDSEVEAQDEDITEEEVDEDATSDDDDEDEDAGGFKINKKKLNKPEIVMTAIGFTVAQTKHLNAVCKANGTKRAEFGRQAIAYCLQEMGSPFPK